MPNPYHDAEGRFCSKEEMAAAIQKAADYGELDLYFRLRQDYELIENRHMIVPEPDETLPAKVAELKHLMTEMDNQSDSSPKPGSLEQALIFKIWHPTTDSAVLSYFLKHASDKQLTLIVTAPEADWNWNAHPDFAAGCWDRTHNNEQLQEILATNPDFPLPTKTRLEALRNLTPYKHMHSAAGILEVYTNPEWADTRQEIKNYINNPLVQANLKAQVKFRYLATVPDTAELNEMLQQHLAAHDRYPPTHAYDMINIITNPASNATTMKLLTGEITQYRNPLIMDRVLQRTLKVNKLWRTNFTTHIPLKKGSAPETTHQPDLNRDDHVNQARYAAERFQYEQDYKKLQTYIQTRTPSGLLPDSWDDWDVENFMNRVNLSQKWAFFVKMRETKQTM